MEIGLGWLKLAPNDFWDTTLAELMAAVDGHVEAAGGGRRADKEAMYDDLLAMVRGPA